MDGLLFDTFLYQRLLKYGTLCFHFSTCTSSEGQFCRRIKFRMKWPYHLEGFTDIQLLRTFTVMFLAPIPTYQCKRNTYLGQEGIKACQHMVHTSAYVGTIFSHILKTIWNDPTDLAHGYMTYCYTYWCPEMISTTIGTVGKRRWLPEMDASKNHQWLTFRSPNIRYKRHSESIALVFYCY